MIKRMLVCLLLLLCACARAESDGVEDITAQCRVRAGGDYRLLTDGSIEDTWRAPFEGSSVTLELPEGITGGSVYVQWYKEPSGGYTLTEYALDGSALATHTLDETFPALNMLYTLEPGTARFSFVLPESARIAEITVFAPGTLPDWVQSWNPPCTDADLMLVVAHQDDEELWFGGLIPYYDVVLEKQLSIVYMTNCSRYRCGEALKGLWDMGVRTYPVFLNYKDAYVSGGRDNAVEFWGGTETVVSRLVQLIEAVKPEVIVTHDIKGEYGHPQHRATSWLVEQAALKCENFTVLKLYRHLGDENSIYMDWNTPSDKLDGLTPLEVAGIGFEAHWSQHLSYDMSWGEKYDNSKFSLIFSRVGEDVLKNDFLENVDPVV